MEPYLRRTSSASYLYTLKTDLKRNKENYSVEFGIKFLPKTYVVSYENKSISKFYGDKIIDEVILDLISDIVNDAQNAIKEIFKD